MTPGRSNIILIGMAGCGKSTVGRMLAGMLDMSFVDTDDLIVQVSQKPLQSIIESEGAMGFRRIEEEILTNVDARNHVIATGGSSIYSRSGMEHLKAIGLIVLLRVRLDVLKKRVGDTSGRGLVKQPGQSFDELYAERCPLYEHYAEVTIDSSDLQHAEVCKAIVGQIQRLKGDSFSFPAPGS